MLLSVTDFEGVQNHFQKSVEFLSGYKLPRVLILLNAGKLATTNTGYKIKNLKPTTLTDRFLLSILQER